MLDVSYVGPEMQSLIADIAQALDERAAWQREAEHATAMWIQAIDRIRLLENENRKLFAASPYPYLPPYTAS